MFFIKKESDQLKNIVTKNMATDSITVSPIQVSLGTPHLTKFVEEQLTKCNYSSAKSFNDCAKL